MSKSLDQFEYEMQHQRFLKVLSEALYEIQQEHAIEDEARQLVPELAALPRPPERDELFIELLAGDFLQTAEEMKAPYKYQFVAVATLVMALMTAYDKAPVDLDKVPVKGKSN